MNKIGEFIGSLKFRFILASSALIFLFCRVSEGRSATNGWIVSQYARNLGIAKVEICPVGVRVDLNQLGLVFVYNDSLDDCFVYSNTTRTICYAKKGGNLYGFFDGVSLEQSGRLFAKFGNLGKPRAMRLAKINSPVSEYQTNKIWLPNRIDPISCEASFCVDDEIKLSRPGLAMVSRLFSLPSLGKFPLECTVLVKEGLKPKPTAILRTLKRENACLAIDDFQPPKGYTKVSDTFAVSGKEEILKSLMDSQLLPGK